MKSRVIAASLLLFLLVIVVEYLRPLAIKELISHTNDRPFFEIKLFEVLRVLFDHHAALGVESAH